MTNELKKYDSKYFEDRGIEPKHYHMTTQWATYFKPKKVYDYGCARGPYIHAWTYLGINSLGFDISIDAVNKPVGLAYGKLFNNIMFDKYDLVTCIDVLEHVHPSDESNVLDMLCKLSTDNILISVCDTLLKDKYVDSTHVNIRTRAYWISEFVKRGFINLPVPKHFYYSEQLLIFKKRGVDVE